MGARATAVGLLTMTGLVVNAGSSWAATTINCDTAAQPSASWTSCQQLTGTAACVFNNGDGTWTIALGYTNPTTATLTSAIPNGGSGGTNNALTATNGSAANPGHIASFPPGTSTTAYTVTWSPTSKTDPVTWVLNGRTFTFTDQITACPTKPVPVVQNAALGGVAAAFILGAVLFRRGRRRGLRIKAVRAVVTA
jgi:hypothetical protein